MIGKAQQEGDPPALTMAKNVDPFCVKEVGIKGEESEVIDLPQMLRRVDEALVGFYEIHGPVLGDQGHNPSNLKLKGRPIEDRPKREGGGE